MCEVRFREKIDKNKPKKKTTMVSREKNELWSTPFDVKWKNVAHPMYKMANSCIGGYWFTLFPYFSKLYTVQFVPFFLVMGGDLKSIIYY
jgi:hypothetical protein